MDGDAGLIAAAAVNPICLWCEGGVRPPQGRRRAAAVLPTQMPRLISLGRPSLGGDGGAQRCHHRRRFADVSGAPCTLAGREEGASDYPDMGSDENAVSAAQRAFMRDMVLGVPSIQRG